VLHQTYDVITSALIGNYKRFGVRFINPDQSKYQSLKASKVKVNSNFTISQAHHQTNVNPFAVAAFAMHTMMCMMRMHCPAMHHQHCCC
jgi:hypothetical protein